MEHCLAIMGYRGPYVPGPRIAPRRAFVAARRYDGHAKVCPTCGRTFTTHKRDQVACSRPCSRELRRRVRAPGDPNVGAVVHVDAREQRRRRS